MSALENSKTGGGTQKSRLTARGITSLTTPGYYSDPDNKCLYLQVSSGLGSFKLQFEGSPHRADVDALNTLRLFFEILHRHNQIYQLLTDAKAVK
ncbi:hypothetical protein A8O14_06410 [Polynucleobacter wuianus]|uniref:Uncharacterized protein n=1 Tax=Polynucleobacter wuianus TaxID=1743168 RepID=A0A191UFR1_9BURK|nr:MULTISPECIES: hypothetical protein [Polynucleobacter]ANI99740.1 hypothetical protein A8O14_06410 [Polynucleobacter wuianus]MBU3552543.1 hypothetical protein [Polynucleobacter sp. MWH-Post4-6-1]